MAEPTPAIVPGRPPLQPFDKLRDLVDTALTHANALVDGEVIVKGVERAIALHQVELQSDALDLGGELSEPLRRSCKCCQPFGIRLRSLSQARLASNGSINMSELLRSFEKLNG